MKDQDHYHKLSGRGVANGSIRPTVGLRIKSFLNFVAHIIFGTLYALEHQHQVTLKDGASLPSSDSITPMASAKANEEALTEIVYTPVANVIIMALNFILACLVLQITFNIDSQIDHISAPTFMPNRL